MCNLGCVCWLESYDYIYIYMEYDLDVTINLMNRNLKFENFSPHLTMDVVIHAGIIVNPC